MLIPSIVITVLSIFALADCSTAKPQAASAKGNPEVVMKTAGLVAFWTFGEKPGKERKRVSGRPGESGEDALVVEPTDLARAVFHDGVAEGYLTVAGKDRTVLVAHGQDRGGMERRVHPCSFSRPAGGGPRRYCR